jgi:hypothetical protein
MSPNTSTACASVWVSPFSLPRIREGRDKGPLERFFRTVRERLLQYLPGYKGPDINSRGLDVEGHAFFYIDQLEAIVREWIAAVYHHTPHREIATCVADCDTAGLLACICVDCRCWVDINGGTGVR